MNQPSSSKYAIAQINIPIEIFPDGEWTNHNDRITIQIVRTDELPPISDIENQQLLETIQEILGGSQESPDDPPTKISLNLSDEDDDDTPLPFIINTREPTSDPPIPPEDNIQSSPQPQPQPQPQQQDNYIDFQELLHRKHRKPSKNNTFKQAPTKHNNKTRSNRWVLMKDTKDAEY